MAQHLGTSSLGPSAGDMQGPKWAIKVCNRALSLPHGPLHMSVLKGALFMLWHLLRLLHLLSEMP